MYSIGYDIGSSSVKAALVNQKNGETVHITSYPKTEMEMIAHKEGWAEQNPEDWWTAVCKVTAELFHESGIKSNLVKSIGISYQMHGLVCVDKNQKVVRPSIIWCDSRAVEIGEQALVSLGRTYCYGHLLNSPGNFTASKLKWVKENEPEIYAQIDKIMLPGDYIGMMLTGLACTTISGLSEGMMWDFENNSLATKVLDHYGIDHGLISDIVPTFGDQGRVQYAAAKATGLAEGTAVTYRAGDQPNNALSLKVLNPGDIAATGGTSGVVYGISQDVKYDPQSRVNGFAHVNHTPDKTRIGQLLCINGAGSQYAWIRQQIACEGTDYEQMESDIQDIPIGSQGLCVLPFGNGVERMLCNQQMGAQYVNVQFNIHSRKHFYRASLEGIAFAFIYGLEILQSLGINPKVMKVGNDNLFQSEVFSMTVANALGCDIEMYETTGAIGAAKVSGIGIGLFETPEEAISDTKLIKTYRGQTSEKDKYRKAYKRWLAHLYNIIKTI